jgi:cation diffusion facilitator CzcD-associated flavoprotein CzcO
MEVWRSQMPKGMRLKSEGVASDLFEPDRRFTMRQFCADHGISYDDRRVPVELDTFVAYGLEFQKKYVPMLEATNVVSISKKEQLFELRLDTGESLLAGAVVMATGINFFRSVPEDLARLPPEVLTHSSAHTELSGFSGRRVAVIGGGSSAVDLAALLHRAGAFVSIICRRPLKFHLPPSEHGRSLWQRLRRPNFGLGPGLRSTIYTKVPGIFHLLPRDLRLWIVRRHLGPSGGWFVRQEVLENTRSYVGFTVREVSHSGDEVNLQLVDERGSTHELIVDHVIAATGYRVSVPAIEILDPRLRSQLKLETSSPILTRYFESSVPGLYFVGLASSNSFGPLMRFALGADYTARRLGNRFASS